VNVSRIIALCALLAASLAGAQESAKARKEREARKAAAVELAKTGQSMPTKIEKPKTCADQCGLMRTMMTENCKKGAGSNKQAQKSCEKLAQDTADTCEGSCAEKGRIDKQYMMERMKPPSGVKLPKDALKDSGGEAKDDAH
jgi:hypothetical protein